ncbi:MAG: ABC transporter ATP-binding protein [Lachnospiraceae bacterium]|nr:ABC transporter ATP-binding protein [Lachnospiraceae bacterium]
MKRGNLGNLLYVLKYSLKDNPKGMAIEFLQGIFQVLQNLPEIIFPSLIINAVLGQKQLDKILVLAGVFAFLVFLPRYILSFLGYLEGWIKAKTPYAFMLRLARKSILLDYKDVDDADRIDQYTHALEMTFRFCEAPGSLVAVGLSSFFELAVLGFLLFTLDGIVAVVLTVTAVVMCLLNRKVAKKEKEIEEERVPARRKAEYAQDLMFSSEFAKDSQAYGASSLVRQKFRRAIEESVELEKHKYRAVFGWQFLQETISSAQTVFLYLFMIGRYAAGAISIGSFTMYISAANRVYNTVSGLLQMYGVVKDFPLYFHNYQDYMEQPEEMRRTAVPDLHIMPDHCPEIEFRNVSFRYPSRSEYALRNVNLCIAPRDHVAVVGENGAGKSTFVKLLLRLYDVTEGEILVDGRNIKDYPYDEYMNLFSTVFQDFIIFIYSAEENIGFDRVEKARLETAMKKAGIYECIERLPRRGKTILGKRYDSEGVDLSGGEKQKVAIARALYKDAPVAVLDEPTAALDPLAEYEVYSNFKGFAEDKTTFYISHRMSSSRFCNRILVFSEGRVAESGTHDELMEKKGIYYDMYEKQASYYKEAALS